LDRLEKDRSFVILKQFAYSLSAHFALSKEAIVCPIVVLESLHTRMTTAKQEIAGNHTISHVNLTLPMGLGLQERAFVEVIVGVGQLSLADDSSLINSVDKILVYRQMRPNSMQNTISETSCLF
jgi:hypothetical protein